VGESTVLGSQWVWAAGVMNLTGRSAGGGGCPGAWLQLNKGCAGVFNVGGETVWGPGVRGRWAAVVGVNL